jgi:hypothetical protein
MSLFSSLSAPSITFIPCVVSSSACFWFITFSRMLNAFFASLFPSSLMHFQRTVRHLNTQSLCHLSTIIYYHIHALLFFLVRCCLRPLALDRVDIIVFFTPCQIEMLAYHNQELGREAGSNRSRGTNSNTMQQYECSLIEKVGSVRCRRKSQSGIVSVKNHADYHRLDADLDAEPCRRHKLSLHNTMIHLPTIISRCSRIPRLLIDRRRAS